MGSGHILVYAFDVLMDIYRSVGYTDRDAVQSIVQNNLYGLDIDDRAAQLAYFAVMMKACEYDRRFLRRGVQPHVCAIAESVPLAELSPFGAEKALAQTLLDTFRDAKEYGSILHVPLSLADIRRLADRTAALQSGQHDTLLSMADNAQAAAAIQPLLAQAQILARQYDAVITNPPYMGASGMNDKLSKFVKDNYPDAKSDLFACFIERGNEWVHPNAISCMVTMQSWMFLSSFEKMRGRILKEKNIVCLMHMENMVMGIAFGTAVTAMRNAHIPAYKGTYNQIKLCDIENEIPKDFPVQGNRFAQVSSDNFSKIPGAPVAYWVSNHFISTFSKGISIDTISSYTGSQNITADNEKYLRYIWEIEANKIGINRRWAFYIKGGFFRKWYGNIELVVDWSLEAQSFYKNNPTSNLLAEQYRFKEGITYTELTSGVNSFRYLPPIAIFDKKGPCIVNVKHNLYCLAFFNTHVAAAYFKLLNPTITLQVKDVKNTPIIFNEKNILNVEDKSNESIKICREDWDTFETSWDFKKHPLI